MTFSELDFKNRYEIEGFGFEPGPKQARVDFPNGYGASVVIGPYTYGGSEGKYELAVMHYGEICYHTELTSDVVGWLSPDSVTKYLQEIEALPENKECYHSHSNYEEVKGDS